MNLEIPAAVVGALTSGMVVAAVSWVKTGREMAKTLATITTEIERIDKERLACRASHDKYDERVETHHQDNSIHISDQWRDEIRSRLSRIEEIQDKVLTRLIHNGSK